VRITRRPNYDKRGRVGRKIEKFVYRNQREESEIALERDRFRADDRETWRGHEIFQPRGSTLIIPRKAD